MNSKPDPWAEMDDWCRRQCKRNSELFEARFWLLSDKGQLDLDDRQLRRLLGNSEAFLRMRSYIHGARAASGIEARSGQTACGLDPKDESPPGRPSAI